VDVCGRRWTRQRIRSNSSNNAYHSTPRAFSMKTSISLARLSLGPIVPSTMQRAMATGMCGQYAPTAGFGANRSLRYAK